MEYLFDNGLSNHYLCVMEAIEYLIEFHDYQDGNINGIDIGIGGDSNTIEKYNIALNRNLKTREYLFWLENDIDGLSTASLFLFHVFLLFNQRYVKDSQLFNTTRSRSIHRIYNVLNGNLAIQPNRRRKILYYIIQHPTKQSVDGYHNNMNGLNNSSGSGGKRGGVDNYDNIGYIKLKMNDTAALATQQTIPSSDINISFGNMIFVDNLIGNTFDISRE